MRLEPCSQHSKDASNQGRADLSGVVKLGNISSLQHWTCSRFSGSVQPRRRSIASLHLPASARVDNNPSRTPRRAQDTFDCMRYMCMPHTKLVGRQRPTALEKGPLPLESQRLVTDTLAMQEMAALRLLTGLCGQRAVDVVNSVAHLSEQCLDRCVRF